MSARSESGERLPDTQNLLVVPGCVVGFSDDAGEFAENIGSVGEVGEVARQGEFSAADGGFAM